MSAEEENETHRFEKPSLETGNLTEITQKAHLISTKDVIPVGSADVAAFFVQVPGQCGR